MHAGSTVARSMSGDSPALYRPSDGPRSTHNMMHDPRIRRGMAATVTLSGGVGPAPSSPTPTTRPALSTTSATTTAKHHKMSTGRFLPLNARTRGPTPFDARPPARPYEPIDLTPFLTEAVRPGGGPTTTTAATQTDAFADVPLTPLYRTPLGGVDASSQVGWGTVAPVHTLPPALAADTLFDFDAAVAPLVHVLVGKVVEQALTELEHEGTLAALERRRREAITRQQAEGGAVATAVNGVVAAAQRRAHLVAAARTRADGARGVMTKVSAHRMGRGMLMAAMEGVRHALSTAGYYVDPIMHAVETDVMPHVLTDLAARMDGVVRATDEAAAHLTAAALDRGRLVVEEAAAAAAAAARRHFIRVNMRVPASLLHAVASTAVGKGGAEVDAADGAVALATAAAASAVSVDGEGMCTIGVGPIPVVLGDTVGDVQAAIHAHMHGTDGANVYRPVWQPLLAALAQRGGRLQLHKQGEPMPLDAPFLRTAGAAGSEGGEGLVSIDLRPVDAAGATTWDWASVMADLVDGEDEGNDGGGDAGAGALE